MLFKIFGPGAGLIFGDTMVLDRWLWLRRRLPKTRNNDWLLDAGCGSGAFSNSAARRGYKVIGVNFDTAEVEKARQRAVSIGSDQAQFREVDLRRLDEHHDLKNTFDVVVCTETIEHIIDDLKVMRDLNECLKMGGRLLLTAPYYYYIAVTPEEMGPVSVEETGGHVRRGYTPAMLIELCRESGYVVEEISYCTGFLSHMLTRMLRYLSTVHYGAAWLVILPFRILPPFVDPLISKLTSWPPYSITLVAYKPRFPE
ncbi:MAG: class I SAM-dependent methyltransferase [Proteobacteria bacterium]|nr:class I SAM-dependent methyltransferase [Pseudomonadota bacterium]